MNDIIENKGTEVVQAEQKSAIDQILDLARDPDFSSEKMSFLIDVMKDQQATQAKAEFMVDFSLFHDAVPPIFKRKSVSIKGKEAYKFAEFQEVYKVLKPDLKKNNIMATWESEPMEDGTGRTKVTCCLHHLPSGHEKTYSVAGLPDASGGKQAIQGVGSTDSYLRRYSLLGACDLIPEGEDSDGLPMSEFIDQDQIEHLQSLVEQTGRDIQSFCQYLKVGALAEIQTAKYGAAVKMLNSLIKNKGDK